MKTYKARVPLRWLPAKKPVLAVLRPVEESRVQAPVAPSEPLSKPEFVIAEVVAQEIGWLYREMEY